MDALLALAADPAAWIALVTLIIMEVVLGIDNLIFIAILTNRLPVDLPAFTGEPLSLAFGWRGMLSRRRPGSCSRGWNVVCEDYRSLRCIGQWH